MRIFKQYVITFHGHNSMILRRPDPLPFRGGVAMPDYPAVLMIRFFLGPTILKNMFIFGLTLIKLI